MKGYKIGFWVFLIGFIICLLVLAVKISADKRTQIRTEGFNSGLAYNQQATMQILYSYGMNCNQFSMKYLNTTIDFIAVQCLKAPPTTTK